MNIEDTRRRNEFVLPSIKVILTSAPSLFFQMTGLFLRFKSSAKKAAKIYYKELRKQGLDDETAKALTKIYLEQSKIRTFLCFS